MASPRFFEDAPVGTPIPPVRHTPTARQLVQWAGASGDFYEIHYNQEAARDAGFEDVVVHGRLKAAFLLEMLADWTGAPGAIRSFSVRYTGVDLRGGMLTCGGVVTEADSGVNHITCELWIANAAGVRTTTATAACLLPRRG